MELLAYNETLIANTPEIDMLEVQNPNPELRIMSITLKPETESTLILMLQNEQIATLRIDDRQVEALILGINNLSPWPRTRN